MKFNHDGLSNWVITICLCVLIGTCTYKEAIQNINAVKQEQKP